MNLDNASLVAEFRAIVGGKLADVQAANRIADMRKGVNAQLDDGVSCPCCGQFAKVYKRTINAGMAASLIRMFRAGAATDYVYLPTTVGSRSREEGKLAYWGLVEEATTPRPDGGRAGYWRMTPRGVRFVMKQSSVVKYAHVYDGEVVGYSGRQVTIEDALGTKFDYQDLMSR